MVAVGPLLSARAELLLPPLLLPEKADESTVLIFVASQVFAMASGKASSSITKTSSAERRPRRDAEAAISFFRVAPRPSAFPVFEVGLSA